MENNLQKTDEITAFVSACNEFVEGKFILADIKVSKILRAVSNSSKIYDLVAESLINYNFNKEYEKLHKKMVAENRGYIELPLDNQSIIPFVFCLLVEIDSKRISFNDFLTKEFPMLSTQKEEYDSFAQHLVIPFRNAIAQIFGVNAKEYNFEEKEKTEVREVIDKEIKEKLLTDTEPLQEEKPKGKEVVKEKKETKVDDETLLYGKVARVAGNMLGKTDKIKSELKRSNLELLLQAIQEACRYKNQTILMAVTMSLNEFFHKEKLIRKDLEELNDTCYEFYN